MTLKEFLWKYPETDYLESNIGFKKRIRHQNMDDEQKWDLFHLDDYAVSASVSGYYYVMVEREVKL